jgi:murein DD-endopeptidase / murein LD-carboxypeptidase
MIKTFRPLISICAASCLFIMGCAGSSPRFTSGNNGTVSDKPRFSYDETPAELTIEKTEIKAEDDRAVSPERLRDEVSRMESESRGGVRSRLMQAVMSYIGTPYRIGGVDHSGIDCSGFSMVVFNSVFNIQLPHSALEQSSLGKRVSKDDLQVGDLVFFITVGRRISHVGIYLGDDLFANASVSQGVTISSLESSYYKRRYAGARKISSTDISDGTQ